MKLSEYLDFDDMSKSPLNVLDYLAGLVEEHELEDDVPMSEKLFWQNTSSLWKKL